MKAIAIRFLGWLALSLFVISAYGGKTDKAFAALREYNYFKAKQIFEKQLHRDPVPAAYGLCLIYTRTDNPFHNIDSALKYVLSAENLFLTLDVKKKAKVFAYGIDSVEIALQKQKISHLFYVVAKGKGTSDAVHQFSVDHFWYQPRDSVLALRDSLAFLEATKKNTWQGFEQFFTSYPQARQVPLARSKYDLLFFKDFVKSGKLADYVKFVRDYPMSPYNEDAQDQVYLIATRRGTIESYHDFILKYPNNKNVAQAWKVLYMKSVKTNSPEEIQAFIERFPDYPFKDDALLDYSLAHQRYFTIRQKDRWGFINDTGRVVIPPQFEWVENFSNGAAAVGRDEKAGFVNKRGDVIVPIIYDDVLSFSHGYAVVVRDDKHGIVNTHGNLVLGLNYDDLGPISNGMIRFLLAGKYGFLNLRFKEVIQPQFISAGDFDRDRAIAASERGTGLIDKSGQWAILPDYLRLYPSGGGSYVAVSDSGYTVLDSNGVLLLADTFDFIGPFTEGVAIIVQDGMYGFIGSDGRIMVTPQYYFDETVISLSICRDGKMPVKNKKKLIGIIDTAGQQILSMQYDDVGFFDSLHTPVKRNGKWVYIDFKQRQTLRYNFDFAANFESGLARVKKKGKWGIINKRGNEVMPFEFDKILQLEDGCFGVERDGLLGIRDYNNQEVLPMEFDKIEKADGHIYRLQKEDALFYFDLKKRAFVWTEYPLSKTTKP
jgi:hypothetical protein